jgi:hypothetical protein
MFELIKTVYVEMKGVVRRLHLLSKKDPEINRMMKIVDNNEDILWVKLEGQIKRSRVKSTMVRGKDNRNKVVEEQNNKRKEISPLEEKRETGQRGLRMERQRMQRHVKNA